MRGVHVCPTGYREGWYYIYLLDLFSHSSFFRVLFTPSFYVLLFYTQLVFVFWRPCLFPLFAFVHSLPLLHTICRGYVFSSLQQFFLLTFCIFVTHKRPIHNSSGVRVLLCVHGSSSSWHACACASCMHGRSRMRFGSNVFSTSFSTFISPLSVLPLLFSLLLLFPPTPLHFA